MSGVLFLDALLWVKGSWYLITENRVHTMPPSQICKEQDQGDCCFGLDPHDGALTVCPEAFQSPKPPPPTGTGFGSASFLAVEETQQNKICAGRFATIFCLFRSKQSQMNTPRCLWAAHCLFAGGALGCWRSQPSPSEVPVWVPVWVPSPRSRPVRSCLPRACSFSCSSEPGRAAC